MRLNLAKKMRSKKPTPKSPRIGQAVAVTLVLMMVAAGLAMAARQPGSSIVNSAPAPAAAVKTAPAKPAIPVKKTATNAKSPNGSAVVTPPVTITGCLEQDHETFRLKDTDGVDAPKSRNWKTGFMTKHNATVTIVDDGKRVKLDKHVGERVSVTGTLVDKDLQVKSLSRVSTGC